MALVKIRRDGNSLAVTIPVEEARRAHLEEGMYVDIGSDAEGHRLHIEPVSIRARGRREVLSAGRQVMQKNTTLYNRLAAHDQGAD